ncbi:uncharacterized protein K444DRAFT_610177 [Hyaloscypha bicolor E]|uniref:Uncharacterized protein n=1 Tax=Hyaloscypha bicolor E TaxID=1095630 RepID=A0A2J6TJZ8_9HELO|nr:uncharacterized protein K444DRAFT_610177 [Hyaloscypha bicolor E]PMD63332.1 hypothetical protein K444DRAFT_610177 [Hyaloscypha bicolor E]
MPEANSVDIEKIAKALDNTRLMVENLEDIVKQRLVHPTEATGDRESTKVGESLSLEGMDHVQLQEQILALSTETTDNHVPAKALVDLSLEGMDFVHVQQSGLADSRKATTAQEILKSLDCGRLKHMNLAYWEEKRLGQHSTEANLDLETAKHLEYLSLNGMDLAYLQQQRLVHCPKATFETDNDKRRIEQATTRITSRTGGGGDNPISAYPARRHYDHPQDHSRKDTQECTTDQYFPHPIAPESAGLSLPFSQQEQRVNRDRCEMGTRSNEVDYFTAYYHVGGHSETVNVNNRVGEDVSSGADTQRPQVLSTQRTKDTIDPGNTTGDTKVQKPGAVLNTAGATKSSGTPRPVVRVAIPKIQSWNRQVTARATPTSGLPRTVVQISTPTIQSSHVQSSLAEATRSSTKTATRKAQSWPVQSYSVKATISPTKPATGEDLVTPKKRQKEFSRPKICTTEQVKKVAPPQETSDIPSIDFQVDTTPKVTTPDPPKTLSKAARKKLNKRQRQAGEKGREHEEAAAIEAAIASNRERRERIDQFERATAAEILLSIAKTTRKLEKDAVDGTNAGGDAGE